MKCASHNCKNPGTFHIGSHGKIRLICFECYHKMCAGIELDLIPYSDKERLYTPKRLVKT